VVTGWRTRTLFSSCWPRCCRSASRRSRSATSPGEPRFRWERSSRQGNSGRSGTHSGSRPPARQPSRSGTRWPTWGSSRFPSPSSCSSRRSRSANGGSSVAPSRGAVESRVVAGAVGAKSSRARWRAESSRGAVEGRIVAGAVEGRIVAGCGGGPTGGRPTQRPDDPGRLPRTTAADVVPGLVRRHRDRISPVASFTRRTRERL